MIFFEQVDPDSADSAFKWHREFAEQDKSVFPRSNVDFRRFVNNGTAWVALDASGAIVGLAYASDGSGDWEIGGLAVTVEARRNGIGLVLAFVTLGHLVFEEDPLADEPPGPFRVIAHVLETNPRPRAIIEDYLRFRLAKSITVPRDQFPGLPAGDDGLIHGDEFELQVPETLHALADWADSWKNALEKGEAASIELREGARLSDWASAFRRTASMEDDKAPDGDLSPSASNKKREEVGVTDERPGGMAKFHALIFSLLFPGLLAAFILTQFTSEALIEGFAPWAWLLCLYFAVQFVEGHEAKTRFRLDRAFVNILEMLGMVLIFAALGYFPDLKVGGDLRSPGAISAMMAAIFALPALYRLVFAAYTLRSRERGYLFARSLTIMSLLAAILSGFFATETWAWMAVLGMLLVYMFAFQFCNEWLVEKLDPKKRPWVADFRRP